MNEKGFGLTELLMFIVLCLIIIVAVVIAINNNFSELHGNRDIEPQIPVQIIGDKEETKKKEEDIKKKIQKEDSEYQVLLDKMTNTAKIYITTNYTGTTDRIIIKTSKLVSDEYMEDLVDPKDKDNMCRGYIIYDGIEEYMPYLNCGKNYISKNYDISFE